MLLCGCVVVWLCGCVVVLLCCCVVVCCVLCVVCCVLCVVCCVLWCCYGVVLMLLCCCCCVVVVLSLCCCVLASQWHHPTTWPHALPDHLVVPVQLFHHIPLLTVPEPIPDARKRERCNNLRASSKRNYTLKTKVKVVSLDLPLTTPGMWSTFSFFMVL